jgi:hypothetical protein
MAMNAIRIFDLDRISHPDGTCSVAVSFGTNDTNQPPFRIVLTDEQAITLALLLVLKASGTEPPPVTH